MQTNDELDQQNWTEVEVATLKGLPLDWAVATLELDGCILTTDGISQLLKRGNKLYVLGSSDVLGYSPSTRWDQGGLLIEREGTFRIIGPKYKGTADHVARLPNGANRWFEAVGPTPLIAAMRCLVSARLGRFIRVPSALVA